MPITDTAAVTESNFCHGLNSENIMFRITFIVLGMQITLQLGAASHPSKLEQAANLFEADM